MSEKRIPLLRYLQEVQLNQCFDWKSRSSNAVFNLAGWVQIITGKKQKINVANDLSNHEMCLHVQVHACTSHFWNT